MLQLAKSTVQRQRQTPLNSSETGLVDQDETTKSFISREIVKMMPRKLTTKELQKIEEYCNLSGVFIDSTDNKGL